MYANGDVIYFDPVTGQKCDTYTESNSHGNNSIGCLKWYAFNDTEANDTVNLILDHNTTLEIMDSTVDAELNKLVTTSQWKYTPRIIAAEEVAQITGKTDFDKESGDSSYFLETNSQEIPSFIDMENPNASAQGKAKYAWLFDYLSNCINYGCNYNYVEGEVQSRVQIAKSGYIVSIENNNSRAFPIAWEMLHGGLLTPISDYNSIEFTGVRPVITISKVLLK